MIATSPLISELRAMPSDRLEETAAYIGTPLGDRRNQRNAMIDATAGSLAGPVGEALEEALAEGETIHEAHK